MPATTDPSSPARARQAAGKQLTQAISAIVAATDLFTVAATTPYTSLQTGDIVSVTGSVTGGAGLVLNTEYLLYKVSATTFKLCPTSDERAGISFLNVTSDMSGGSPLLTYGNPRANLQPNIVSAGSVRGGGFGGVDV